MWIVLADGVLVLAGEFDLSGRDGIVAEGDVCGLDGCGCEKSSCGCDHGEFGMVDLGDCVIREVPCGDVEEDILGLRVPLDYLDRVLLLLELGDVGDGAFEGVFGLSLFGLDFRVDRPPRVV